MRSTTFAIITLAGSVLLVAAPALTGDDSEQRSTPAFETPGTGPTPGIPTGHDPGPTPDPVMESDPPMRPDPAMGHDDPAQNDDPAMKNDDPTMDDPPMRKDDPAIKPGISPSPRAAATGREYVVEAGDTLGEIAERELGSANKWREIARANGVERPETLRVGQKLQIPRADAPDTSEDHSKL